MKIRFAIVAVAAVLLACGSLVHAREPYGESGITAEQLLAEALAGDPAKEVNVQRLGTSTPTRMRSPTSFQAPSRSNAPAQSRPR